MKGKIVAICLAAGQGKRMQSKIQKQYMMLKNKPVVCYSLDAFEKSEVEEVILVVAPGEETYCKKEIVDKYKYAKVKQIVSGGKERYHSVANGLNSITDADYVLIHDGARPMLNQEILQECIEGVKKYKACITAMPVKDTIKISDEDEYIQSTPPRSRIWQIQTPQCFSFSLIKEAYERLIEEEKTGAMETGIITDDAMVVETYMNHKVRLIRGSYTNIKITTPEDLKVAAILIEFDNDDIGLS